jgi:hypothetical protein
MYYKYSILPKTILQVFFGLSFFPLFSQPRTVGLTVSTKDQSGAYVLFSPLTSTQTYLIDACGRQVHNWSSEYTPGNCAMLLNDGSLLRAGSPGNTRFGAGQGGIIERFAWNQTRTWSFTLNDSFNVLHHDIKPMPNGHYLAIVWEWHTRADAVAYGRVPTFPNVPIWSERIVEIAPVGADSGTIVWEWRAWDHMIQDYSSTKPNFGVVADHPERININYYPTATPRDWFHINSIDYNPKLDQILLSVHNLNEIWIIDHSTTKAEAKGSTGGKQGKGGDLLYRWGNPEAYNRGKTSDMRLFNQHHATWIPDSLENGGKILLFNNGQNRPGTTKYSTVDIVETSLNNAGGYDIDSGKSFKPDSQYIAYKASPPESFYSANISGCRPMNNGGFFITSGFDGKIFEVTKTGEIVWQYINPDAGSVIIKQGDVPNGVQVFRAERYPANFSGFKGKTLFPGAEIEIDPIFPSICYKPTNSFNNPAISQKISFWPNPASGEITLANQQQLASLLDLSGREVAKSNQGKIAVKFLPAGFYILKQGQNSFKVMVQPDKGNL